MAPWLTLFSFISRPNVIYYFFQKLCKLPSMKSSEKNGITALDRYGKLVTLNKCIECKGVL